MPWLAKRVMNVRRPEWLLAPVMPALRYIQWNHWAKVLASNPARCSE